MKRIGICTLYTGYNCGSALQAFAIKNFLKKLNYDVDILKLAGSLIKGRDIRIKKAFITFFRMLLFSKNRKATIKSFGLLEKNQNEKMIEAFNLFYENRINPKFINYNNLKRVAKTDYYTSFICGSDQIWNSTAFYVDPFYYLKFAPSKKRVAYAPSFGREYIPNYNKKIITKYIEEMKAISIRETTGKRIIFDLTGKNVPTMPDPTMLLKKDEWIKLLNLKEKNNQKYVFAYFLNEPSDTAKKMLKKISSNHKILYFNSTNDYGTSVTGGPVEFLEYLLGSEMVITDSFHGVAFSINFHKQFYVFDRNYVTENQSTRIQSLLEMFNLKDKFNSSEEITITADMFKHIDNKMLEEKEKAIKYLKDNL